MPESLEFKRMTSDLNKVQILAERADEKADMANNSISKHEEICAVRYESITKQLANIPNIYGEIKALSRWVYIGVGICTAIVFFGEMAGLIHKIGG